jgi:hypothetical protein
VEVKSTPEKLDGSLHEPGIHSGFDDKETDLSITEN